MTAIATKSAPALRLAYTTPLSELTVIICEAPKGLRATFLAAGFRAC